MEKSRRETAAIELPSVSGFTPTPFMLGFREQVKGLVVGGGMNSGDLPTYLGTTCDPRGGEQGDYASD